MVLLPFVILNFATYHNIETNESTLNGIGAGTLKTSDSTSDFAASFNGDISSMFNERGFSKSNAASVDENEIISEYNGNLNYSIPLYNFKGPGDLNMNVSLNYNGSVAHQMMIASSGAGSSWNNEMPKYNLNFPEWMISVNGIAVQVLNFETNYFTITSNGTTVLDNNVHPLVTGYQLTDNPNPVLGTSKKDRISILNGDGSVTQIQNLIGSKYTGTYYSTAKKDYTFAIVDTLEGNSQPNCPVYYKNRVMYLMKGDGLTYQFEEEKAGYHDYPRTSDFHGTINSPQIMLLKYIWDRFGHYIAFSYQGGYGRPLLSQISTNSPGWGNIEVFYQPSPSGGLSLSNVYNGTYKIKTDDYDFSSGAKHRVKVDFVENPMKEKIDVSYQNYTRESKNLSVFLDPSSKINAKITNLTRISSLSNFAGGKRTYTYKGDPVMSIDNTPLSFNYKIHSDWHKGQGRDAFYTNMVEDKNTYQAGASTHYRNENFYYDFTDVNGDFDTNPVDQNDDYKTYKTINSNASNNYTTPSSFTNIKYYQNFRTEVVDYTSEVPDYTGEIKIKGDRTHIPSEDNFIEKYFTFDKGSEGSNGTWNGSFLDTEIGESYKGIYKSTSISYEYSSNLFSSNSYNNPIKKKTVTDDFGNKTITYFINDTVTSFNYVGGIYTIGATNSFNYTKGYYLNIPYRVERRNSSNALLSRELYEYLTGSNNSLGYPYQLSQKKTINISDTNQYLSNSYSYYKRDTIGFYVHNLITHSGAFPENVEGNVKSETDPNGNTKMFYYYPISTKEKYSAGNPTRDEFEGPFDEATDAPPNPPEISYIKAFEYYKDTVFSSAWQDSRLPTRIDTYSDASHYLTDYFNYNIAGDITKNINKNHYLSVINYDELNRIKNSTLPYDFNSTFTYDSTAYDTIITVVNSVFGSDMWGMKNAVTGENFHGNSIGISGVDFQTYFNLGYYHNSSGYVNKNYAKMRFPYTSLFSNLYEIFSASLEFYPTFFDHHIGSDTDRTHFRLSIFPISGFLDPPITESYSAYKNNVNTIHNINRPTVASGPRHVEWCDMQWDFYNSVDVTEQLKAFCLRDHHSFEGFMIGAGLVGTYADPLPPHNIELELSGVVSQVNGATCWKSAYSPKLRLSGKTKIIRPRIVKVYQRGTVRYVYDDANNKVTSFYKMENIGAGERGKKSEYIYDGFYKGIETRQFTDNTNYNAFKTEYNYLDLKSKSIDARNLETKFSYDEFLNNSRTDNADTSYTLVNDTYQTNFYGYYFGTLYGFVNVKEFVDEVGNRIKKYYDNVGNLRTEERYISGYSSGDTPLPDVPLATDYLYDDLYRVVQVATPERKIVHYSYDGYGRMVQKQTVDAGIVIYKYDKAGNLRFSQDQNQSHAPSIYRQAKRITFRRYDGLNRLLCMGEALDEENTPDWNSLAPNDTANFERYAQSPENFLTINVYDTLASAIANIFSGYPSGYYSVLNKTKGNLIATAYRTRSTDNWNYKFYRYDARGRVLRMWNIIDGLGTKTTDYFYDSQNNVTIQTYESGQEDYMVQKYSYDDAGRLTDVNIPISSSIDPEISDSPSDYFNFVHYDYNANSQIDSLKLNRKTNKLWYNYNRRNWVTFAHNSLNIMQYLLTYAKNGNITNLSIAGTYNNNFSDNSDFSVNYTYDKANRLIKTSNAGLTFAHILENTYDKDGNIYMLTRSNNGDNFSYQYYSGTNKLKSITGGGTQYNYDANGNMIKDSINRMDSIRYDYRNLIIEIKSSVVNGGAETPETPATTYRRIRYYYDETGNRIRKRVLETTNSKALYPDWDGNSDMESPGGPGLSDWIIVNDEYYARDIFGNEKAIYNDNSLSFWNIHGSDNLGRINADTSKQFYLKDYLGNIRAVTDASNALISAYDYDAWGYKLREWESKDTKYYFTSKERDAETSYDYFGARYYDSRIGRWGGTEPLLEKYISFSPYNYALCSPVNIKDINGKDAIIDIDKTQKHINIYLYFNFSKYSATNPQGLLPEQIEALKEYKEEIENRWSGSVDTPEGSALQGYTFEVQVILQQQESYGASTAFISKNEGQNLVKNAEEEDMALMHGDMGLGASSNVFFINKEFRVRENSFVHEVGHLLGLKDKGHNNYTIMGYGYAPGEKKRDVPRSYDRTEILDLAVQYDRINLSSTTKQVITGVNGSNNKPDK
jgi:RHS repeat-associated protein